MFKRFLLLALVLGLMSSVSQAGVTCPDGTGFTIMLISDSGYGNDGDVDQILDGNGYTKALGGKYVDETLVRFLENAGYTVDTSGMGGNYRRKGKDPYGHTTDWWDPADTTGRKAALESACLVIVSKCADSGSYARTDGTSVAWNTLPVPLLSQNAHLLRGQGAAVGGGSTKWGWNNGNNGRQYQGCLATEMAALPVNHPAYSWVCKTNLFDYTGNEGNGPKDTRGNSDGRDPDLCIGDWVPEADILGYLENDASVWGVSEMDAANGHALGPYDNSAEPWKDHAIMVYIPMGADFEAHNSNGDPLDPIYGYAGADRGFLGIWSYDGSPDYYWGMDLTTDYKDLFCLIVHDMVPEPATIALLGLGGLSLLRRKRN